RIPTGFADLDTLTSGGLRPGRMVVVGARPGVGKTLFGTGLARSAAHAVALAMARGLITPNDLAEPPHGRTAASTAPATTTPK
ncbi:hypothetical protein KBZ21_39660, partial [Streptomyces sp. A73]|nr:hypothetical protein [Streptomyces sp. A73]